MVSGARYVGVMFGVLFGSLAVLTGGGVKLALSVKLS